MEIVDVRALDGQRIEPDEYWLHVEDDGFFTPNADVPLTQEHGRWERR